MAVSLSLTSILAPTAAANAIGFLISANPALGQQLTSAPHTVTLEFSVATIPAQLSGNVIRVTNSAGVSVDQGEVRDSGKTIAIDLKSDLGPDRYQVAYRYVCDDGHVLVSAYSFTVASATNNPPVNSSPTPHTAKTQIPKVKPSASQTAVIKPSSTPTKAPTPTVISSPTPQSSEPTPRQAVETQVPGFEMAWIVGSFAAIAATAALAVLSRKRKKGTKGS